MKTRSSLFILVATISTATVLAKDEDVIKSFDSPDKRFTLRVIQPSTDGGETKLQLVEKASDKVVGDLGTDYPAIMQRIKVVWSGDSQRVAYRTADQKEWRTEVYFWDGSAFKYVALPQELPSPDITFRKTDEQGGVKNYGGGTEPVRWLKSGDLELLSEQTQMARESSRSYTGSMTITIAFDAQHRASVKSVSKSKTRVE
jgi:hypothetical protein